MVNRESNVDSTNAVRPGFRMSLRVLLVFVTTASLVVAGGVWLNKKLDEYSIGLMVGNPGPVENSEDWPRALKELFDKATEAKIDIEVMEVHCIQSGWDEEYIWRMKADPNLLDLMKEKLEMQNVAPPGWSYFVSNSRCVITELQIPPWQIPDLDDADYFACPSFIAGDANDQFELVHDKTKDIFVIHYYYDF